MDNIETALEYLGQLHKQTKKEWNSVKDVYPKDDSYVICANERGVFVCGCWFSRKTMTWYAYGSASEQVGITHWMRYPELPKP